MHAWQMPSLCNGQSLQRPLPQEPLQGAVILICRRLRLASCNLLCAAMRWVAKRWVE